MLEELKEFLNIPKNPPKIKMYSTYLINTKNKRVQSYKEDLRRLSSQKKITIMEKILQRQKKEQEKKRKEMFDTLHKNKKMNLRQFLSRMQNFEEKRKYNLELKKYQKLKQETSFLREKPKINSSSLKLYENLPKEPLYKRTEGILDEKKKMIENLTIFYTLPKEIQKQKDVMRNRYKKKYNSAENSKIDYDDHEYTIKSSSMDNMNMRNRKNKKREKMTKQKSDEFYNKQEEWYKNKKAKEQYFEKLYQMQNHSYSDITFHPYVNQVTLEILDVKNRLNTNNDEFYKYNITNNKSQYDMDLNKGRTIFDKLYEEGYRKNFISQEDFFKSINYDESFNYNYNIYQMRKKNKYKNIPTKYLDIYKNKENKTINKDNNSLSQKNISIKNNIHFRKKPLKTNKSFDDINSARYINNMHDNTLTPRNARKLNQKNKQNKQQVEESKYKKNEEIDNYQWKNSLLNLKSLHGKTNDITYHINIRQRGAWDNNFMNNIILDKNENTKALINSIVYN